MLIVKRNIGVLDTFTLGISLDGKEIARIGRGETREFPLEKGEHTIFVTWEEAKTDAYVFTCEDGETVEFETGCSMSAWNVLNFLFIGIFYVPHKDLLFFRKVLFPVVRS